MSELTKIITERRSCRHFKPEKINDDELNDILNAGLRAPSGGNFQSCHFTVLENKEIVKQINVEVLKHFATLDVPYLQGLSKKENYDIFYNAPTVVVLSANSTAITPGEDTAVASQNMMLMAQSLGIGSCWISFGTALMSPENHEKFSKLLELPESHYAHHAMIFGYRDGKLPEPLKIKEGRVNYIG